ncbi:hypothetical protein Hanom_Chr13g01207051 [Helianthus anomalus]
MPISSKPQPVSYSRMSIHRMSIHRTMPISSKPQPVSYYVSYAVEAFEINIKVIFIL